MNNQTKYPHYKRLGTSVSLSLLTYYAFNLLCLAYSYFTRVASNSLSFAYDDGNLFLNGEVVGIEAFSTLGYVFFISLLGMYFIVLSRRASGNRTQIISQ